MAFLGVLDILDASGNRPTPEGPFKAGATALNVGMPVKLSSGLIVVSATNDTSFLGFMANECDASGEAMVYVATPNLRFKCNYDGTYTQSRVGGDDGEVEITVSATALTVNLDETTNELFVLLYANSTEQTAKQAWFKCKHGCCQVDL
jgi:hypothetical protein